MSDPIVFISRNRIKDGFFEDFRKHYQASIPVTEAGKPGTLVQLAYVDEEATEVVIVRVFADAEGMDQQLQGADQRSKATYQYIEPTSVEVYGEPNPSVMEMINKIAGSGIEVTVNAQFIGGLIRPIPDDFRSFRKISEV